MSASTGLQEVSAVTFEIFLAPLCSQQFFFVLRISSSLFKLLLSQTVQPQSFSPEIIQFLARKNKPPPFLGSSTRPSCSLFIGTWKYRINTELLSITDYKMSSWFLNCREAISNSGIPWRLHWRNSAQRWAITKRRVFALNLCVSPLHIGKKKKKSVYFLYSSMF